MEIRIRHAVESDVETIFDIRTSVKENHLSRAQLADRGITPESIRELILAAPCAWIAEADGITAGFSMADADEGSVFALFVRPGLEGRGLGTRLMEKVEEFLFQRYEKIWLTTEDNSRANSFYRSRGWGAVPDLAMSEIRLEKYRPAAKAE